jgi:hypothetical protein
MRDAGPNRICRARPEGGYRLAWFHQASFTSLFSDRTINVLIRPDN